MTTMLATPENARAEWRRQIRADRRLSDVDLLVLTEMDRHIGPDGTASPGIDALQTAVGVGRRSVVEALRRARGCGYVARVSDPARRPRKSCDVYRLQLPAAVL